MSYHLLQPENRIQMTLEKFSTELLQTNETKLLGEIFAVINVWK